MEVLDSQNKKFGFYGTNTTSSRKKAKTEWAAAFQGIAVTALSAAEIS